MALRLLVALAPSLIITHSLAAPPSRAAPVAALDSDPIIHASAAGSRDLPDLRRALSDDSTSAPDIFRSKVSSLVANGVADLFQGLPNGQDVQALVGLRDSQVAKLPIQVINLPPYANWTHRGWNVRFHGNVLKQPELGRHQLDDLTNTLLIDTKIQDLPPSQAEQARNVTSQIFVIQQGGANVSFELETGAGGAVTPDERSHTIRFPYSTTTQGDFDAFVPIVSNSLRPGNVSNEIQRLGVYINGAQTGNATAYLVPPHGLTVLSDIDDILRITKIYRPEEGLLNTIARPYIPWMNMPEIFANWSTSLPNTHFHYLTTTPEQITRPYMQFIYSNYPGGSFDTRPLNFSDMSATLSIRKFLLAKIFETFPQRKFILVADTTNSDVLRAYPSLAHDYPRQVQCIFIRNTTATDPANKFPYDTSGFEGLDDNKYLFFNVPVTSPVRFGHGVRLLTSAQDDLKGLDVLRGQCNNRTVQQSVTFGLQGLPLGINFGGGKNTTGN
ncbi:MAG: hypothetical protein M1817_000945 [Caeruleum heppii]|nr:MAG: hypothetical protein M1817_000945 [Caeruleum heppii]